MSQFGSQVGCITEDGLRETAAVGRGNTPTPYPSPQGGGETGEASPRFGGRRVTGRRFLGRHVRGNTPTPDPSPQGGGELGEVAPLTTLKNRVRHPRIPLPLVGRGKGWGSPRSHASAGGRA